MCGIVGGFASVERGVQALAHRGRDANGMIQCGKLWLGHTRLSIIDLDERSNQPFIYGSIALVFNGEIWNYKALRLELIEHGFTFKTTSDTEVLAALLEWLGLEALPKLQGMFSIAWTQDGETLYLARDRFGETPLHLAKQKPFYFASELKGLKALGANPLSFTYLPAGHYAIVTSGIIEIRPYYHLNLVPQSLDRNTAAPILHTLLRLGTQERTITDVPVCTLLSGGIDSAAVALFLKECFPDLIAYTAVMNPKSSDLKAARLIAHQLGIELREVLIAPPSADDLADVIGIIEMPYKAQVEIGYACLQLAKQIQYDGFKVTYSGEGSDELWASYGFAYHALQSQDWYEYRRDLFMSQQIKNFMRCNKVFMAYGIECRLPFLSTPLVEFALTLSPQAVQEGRATPKAIMRDAFTGYLPREITHRSKVAFQDGLGLKKDIEQRIRYPKRFYQHEYKRQYLA